MPDLQFNRVKKNLPDTLEFTAPGSKSVTNRILICSALNKNKNRISNFLLSEDTLVMINALSDLGFKFKYLPEIKTLEKIGYAEKNESEIYLGYAGTAYRFLLALLIFLRGKFIFKGEKELHKRPITELIDSLNQIIDGNIIQKEYSIESISAGQKKINCIKIDAQKSSQFLTALLLTAPAYSNDFTITSSSEIVSKTYIDMTIKMLKELGVNIINDNYKEFKIAAGQKYNFADYNVEGDYSAASYFAGTAMLTGKKTVINNLNPDCEQGDKNLFQVFKNMGAGVINDLKSNRVIIIPDKNNFTGAGTVDMSKMQDVVPTLATVAAFAEGKTEIVNIGNLRFKECDRFSAIFNELKKCGVDIKSENDSLIIEGKKNHTYYKSEINTYKDHRMAMAFSLLALKIPEINIKSAECVSKTFPEFYAQYLKLFDMDINPENYFSEIYKKAFSKFNNNSIAGEM